ADRFPISYCAGSQVSSWRMIQPEPTCGNVTKMWMPWSSVRQCPQCGSFDVHRHRGGGPFKRFILQLVFLRVYSCMDCNGRYHGYSFSRRKAEETGANN